MLPVYCLMDPNLFDTLSQSNAIVRDARGLARLDDAVLEDVIQVVNNERLPANVAALIPNAGRDPAIQRLVLKELTDENAKEHITPTAAQNLIYAVQRNVVRRRELADTRSQIGFEGMGMEDLGASAWRERDAIQRGLRQAFTADQRLFGQSDPTKIRRPGFLCRQRLGRSYQPR